MKVNFNIEMNTKEIMKLIESYIEDKYHANVSEVSITINANSSTGDEEPYITGAVIKAVNKVEVKGVMK